MAKEESVDRRGMLLKSEHLAERAPSGQDEIPPKLVMAFCGELVRNTWNWDLIELCTYTAKELTGSTKEERLALSRALKNFQNR